jgi:DNA-binding Lrp family transcriptional regulator
VGRELAVRTDAIDAKADELGRSVKALEERVERLEAEKGTSR